MKLLSSLEPTKKLEPQRFIPVILLSSLLLPLALYLLLQIFQSYDPTIMQIRGHFYIVSAVSLLSAGVAICIGWVATKVRNIQVVLVALAFISLSIVFAMHGLATPGFILERNRIISIAAPLSLLLNAYWLFLSSLSSNAVVVRRLSKYSPYLIPGWTSLLVLFGLLLFTQPDFANQLPIDSNPLKLLLTFIAMELNIVTAWRYWQSYRYTRAPLQLAIVFSAGWLAVSLIIMATGVVWHGSWWLYHGLLLLASAGMIFGLAHQYLRGTALNVVLAGLWNRDPLERLEAAISPDVRNLISQTEQHDFYTAGHNRRVAMLAVQLGEVMGLSPETLRALAQGGIVHDIGKLEVPAEILNKPGKLEDAERNLINAHPANGWKLCKSLGFMPEELAIIRHHHEHWDGNGYPDKLSGEAIPLLARIMAVADVYDALTSKRSYRQPWSHEQASQYICAHSGTQFCPSVVEAWQKMLAQTADAESFGLRESQIRLPELAVSS